MSDPIHGARELFKDYLKERGVTEAPASLFKIKMDSSLEASQANITVEDIKRQGVKMSEQQDWALKLALDLIDRAGSLDRETFAPIIAIALKQEREIGRLEANRSFKWPAEIPEERVIHARDDRGELVMHVEYEWLKQHIEAIRHGRSER